MTGQSLKQAALDYIPQTTKNITELKTVPVEILIQDGEGQTLDDKGEMVKFSYKFIEIDGEKYRVPATVLSSLKAILEKKPTLKFFSVSKTGTGRQTKYTVIPMD